MVEEVDWAKFLDRRRSCFIYHPYMDAEFNLLLEETDFQYKHHLYKWSRGSGVHYRSEKELEESMKHFAKLVKDLDRVKEFRGEALRWDEKTKELVKHFKETNIELDEFEKYYKEFVKILLYTVTIPYLCLSGIDYAINKGIEKEEYEQAIKVLNPLRGFTTYPQLERVMLSRFWKSLSEKTGTALELIDKLTPWEIIDYINGEELPSEKTLKKRAEWCIFWHDEDNLDIKYSYDKTIEERIPVLAEEEVEEKEIRGSTAMKGAIKGRVCRVDNAEDMKKFREGDIIVSINTSPDLMPVLEKCSAIVSDEGGIMCHAAIVARELKKPCIIGTKHATKIFKDNDIIEVDAENGIVRKIT